MTIQEAEALLLRNIVAELGEARAVELAAAIRSAAEALTLVMNESITIDEEDPDFTRPLV